MDSFPVTKLNRATGEILDAAYRRPVELTDRGKRKYVLMAADYYDKLFKQSDTRRAYSIYDLPPDIKAQMLAAIDEELGHSPS